MKRLMKFAVGLLIAYLFFRLLTEYLRPVRRPFQRQPISMPPHREPAPEPGRVNLNEADASALSTLPGIGPTLAERIISRRQEIGSFVSLEDLTQVRGVGRTMIQRLRPLVTFH